MGDIKFNKRVNIVLRELYYYAKCLKWCFAAMAISLPWGYMWRFLDQRGFISSTDTYLHWVDSEYRLVMGVFFIAFLNAAWTYYRYGPNLYLGLLDHLLLFSIQFFAFVNHKGKMNCEQEAEDMKDLAIAFAHHIHAIFMPHHYGEVFYKFSERNQEIGKKIKGENMSALDAIELIFFKMLSLIKVLGDESCISTQEGNILFESLKPVMEVHREIKNNEHVKDLNALYIHGVFISLIFFVYILPYELSINTGDLIYIFYPMLIFSLAGVIFIAKYVGSPFSKTSPVKHMEFRKWRNRTIEKIQMYSEL